MGEAGQGRMGPHRQKKLGREDLGAFRNRVSLQADGQQMSMTMALARMLAALLKGGALGPCNLQPKRGPAGPQGRRGGALEPPALKPAATRAPSRGGSARVFVRGSGRGQPRLQPG